MTAPEAGAGLRAALENIVRIVNSPAGGYEDVIEHVHAVARLALAEAATPDPATPDPAAQAIHATTPAWEKVVEVAKAEAAESPPALDVERLTVALKRHNCNGDPTPRACAEAIAREYAAISPTDDTP